MSRDFDIPGRIKCGTIAAPAFDVMLADYTGLLGLAVIESGTVPADLAAAWGAPASAGRRTWHWIRNGKLETRTAIEDSFVTGDWRSLDPNA